MKVCGFTFIRNAVKFDFPVVEAIRSVLPVCDHFIVAVGKSDDQTRAVIEQIDPVKITIIDTVWDESLKKGGEVYAVETNKAFDAIPSEFDWCFYIQGDEVLHEKFLNNVKTAMTENLDRKEVDGLLFGFRHFYGTYDYVGDCRHWYRNEIRIIRNDKSIRSFRDAQGFKKDGKLMRVVKSNAEIYHYGWVRNPQFMQEKIDESKQFYNGVSTMNTQTNNENSLFDYSNEYDALTRFEGTHPAVMHDRIERLNWQVDIDLKKVNMNLRYWFLYKFEKWFGVRLFEYRNYRLIRN